MENQETIPNAGEVGLKDRLSEGWLNRDTRELAPGLVIEEGQTVVDIGCGDGGYITFCAKQNANVIFVDRDSNNVAWTEKKVEATGNRSYQAIVSDCDPIPLEDGTADILICTEVLEHVPDPVVFLRELIRVVKPGSNLLLTVPDSRSEQFVACTAPPECFQEPNHIRIFSSEQFEELVNDAGLEILDHHYLGGFWSIYWPLAWLVAEPFAPGLPINHPDPITVHWTKCWQAVQNHPEGMKVIEGLNQVLPKSQAIIARKPLK